MKADQGYNDWLGLECDNTKKINRTRVYRLFENWKGVRRTYQDPGSWVSTSD